MESRPGDTSTPANLLKLLPPEIQLGIFNLSDLQSLGRMLCTSKYFSDFFDDRFWNSKQTQEFPPTPFSGDNKKQYLAEYFYQHAMSFTDADKRQINSLKLRRFLQQSTQPWSHYYRGLTFYRGLGVKKDRALGFQILIDGLDIEDYRAAILIARILVTKKPNNPNLFQQLIALLNQDRQQLLLKLILKAHAKKTQPVAKLLGQMHALGIAAEQNFSITEKYYLDASTDLANTLSELARLKIDSLPETVPIEQRAAQTVTYLKSFKNRVSLSILQSIINYWSAFLEITRGDNNAAIRLLEHAPDFAYAERLHAHLLAENNLPELGALHLVDLATGDDDICVELFDMQLKFSTICDAVKLTKELTDCRMITLARSVSAIYRRDINFDALAADPYSVWWLQLAAQAGCKESLTVLLKANAKQYPYISYALAIIYKFGIFHSDSIEPNDDKAEYYFHLAGAANLTEYRQTGIDHEFACAEVIDLLQSRLELSVKCGM